MVVLEHLKMSEYFSRFSNRIFGDSGSSDYWC